MAPPVRKFKIIFLFCILHFALNCYAGESKPVRVLIVPRAESLSLKVDGPYQIEDSGAKEIIAHGSALKTAVVTYRNGIVIGKVLSRGSRVFIHSDDSGVITINNRKFRGNVEIIEKDASYLQVVNYIELEDYIKGILYHEVSHYWPIEALKAQAVACRTFALSQMRENAAKDYDVTSDIYSQVYGGKASERYRTNKAVRETKSEILTFAGEVFPAYYHATCGGYTEDASLLWNINIAPLKGVPCGFCKGSPHFNWHLVLSQEKIAEALSKIGYSSIGKIKNIAILGKDLSGRNKNLKIITDKKDFEISAKDFRNAVGPNVLRSAKFDVELVDGDAVFTGFGWGHGVGMCQWGAYFMAKQGYDYKQILQYYYPQANVEAGRF